MRLKSIGVALALSCLAAAGACTRTPSSQTTVPATVTTLSAVNEGAFDMEVFVTNSPAGDRTRLGIALANATTPMTIPATIMLLDKTELKFFADPVGRKRTSVSRSIVVTRGDVVTLRIPPG